MDTIRIRNFRSIVDSKELKLSKLNFLIGRNSSGKSSFLRVFPMFKESSKHELRGPLLWFDEDYDFGSFANARNRQGPNEDGMVFNFEWDYHRPKEGDNLYFDRSVFKSTTHVNVELSLDAIAESSFIKFLSIKLREKKENHEILIVFDTKSGGNTIEIDKNPIRYLDSFWDYSSKGVLPKLQMRKTQNLYRRSKELAKEILHLEKDDAAFFLLFDVDASLYSTEQIVSRLSKVDKSRNHEIDTSSDSFLELKDILSYQYVSSVVNYTNEYLSDYFGNTFYITPLRYNFSRFMRNRELSVDYIESTGKNVMEYFLSLTKEERRTYNQFLKDTIGVTMDVKGEENNSIYITDSEGTSDNIVDVGYGISQVLPIATTIWDRAFKTKRLEVDTIVIEQPEVHLHPAMQKSLARLFIKGLELADNRKKKIILIVETHSSVLINQIGKSVYYSGAKDQLSKFGLFQPGFDVLSPSDVSLFLFDKKEGITEISRTEYNILGEIESWPVGFLG